MSIANNKSHGHEGRVKRNTEYVARIRNDSQENKKVNLCLFDLNLSMKPVKKVFVYKYKLSLGLALRHLAYMFINKLSIKFNSFLTEWFLIQREFTTPFEEISAKELHKCLQTFYLSARKRNGRSVIACQNCNEIVGNSK